MTSVYSCISLGSGKSIYYGGSTKSIYFSPNDLAKQQVAAQLPNLLDAACPANDNLCLTKELLQKFETIVTSTIALIDTVSRLNAKAVSTLIVKITSFAFMNDFTYVRFVWMQRHPKMIFDPMNMSLRYEILRIYLEFEMTSWVNDPLVNTLMPASALAAATAATAATAAATAATAAASSAVVDTAE